MNKKELIEKINNLSYTLTWNTPRINREIVIDLIEQLDEPQKVTIPQFVADWIEEGRKHCKDVSDLFGFDFTNEEVGKWFLQEKPFDLVARAWLDGYKVEKEKRYLVKMKDITISTRYLKHNTQSANWFLSGHEEAFPYRTKHTRKELEQAGFGWVFDCEGVEIEEVEG